MKGQGGMGMGREDREREGELDFGYLSRGATSS